MPYVDIATLQTIAAGQPFAAPTLQQIRDNEEFLIDPPACSVYNTLAQTRPTGTTFFALLANIENYDNDSMHSTSTNTSRITIQTAGRYEVGCAVAFDADSSNLNRTVIITVNALQDYTVGLVDAATGNSTGISGSRTLVLSAGDYVECWVWQNSGVDVDVRLQEFYALFRTR